MNPSLPRTVVPRRPASWLPETEPHHWPWSDIPPLSPFILHDGSGPAQQQTSARLCYDPQRLYVRFDCQDADIWGTYTQRDAPIYDEEVVETFLAAGEADPIHYAEFEVSPNGVLFDAQIYNPSAERVDLEVDVAWDCQGLYWRAGRNDAADHWWAVLGIPWAGLTRPEPLPGIWRANFFRIERPRDGLPEFSCWSPSMAHPADFHKPACFGTLILAA